jgi:tetratricopeptide (TPR) repeat protein
MSGAALLSAEGHHVLGVVVSDPHAYPGARIEATRAEALLANEEFRRLVGASADDLEGLPRHTFLAPAQRRLPAARTEVDLLLAPHAVVDYIPHIAEAGASGPEPLDALTHWCEGEPVFSVAVLTGDGGSGKTRLATELCRTMSERGWQNGYLDVARPQAGWEIDGATLLVVDDVEYAAPVAGELLRQLAARPGGPPVRVLLVARRRSGSHWTIQLGAASDGVLERHTDLEVDLNAFCLSPTSRRRHMAEAARAFARTLGTAVPARLPEVDDPEFANPLLTHALALLTVCGEHVDVGGDGRVREQVMRTLLHRERRRWESQRAVLRLEELADQRVQSAAVIVVTLTAPTEDEAVELLTAVPLLDDMGPGVRRRTATWLRDLFPASPEDTDGRIRGPALDLVVEALVAEQDPVVTRDLLTRLCTTEAATDDRIAHALQVIRLAAENREVPREILRLFLEHHLRELVQRTLQPGGHRLASALSMSIAFTSTVDGVSADLLDSCLDAAVQLPHQRPGTAELAAILYDIYLTWLDHLGDRLAELPDSKLVDSDLADKFMPFRLAALHEAGLRYHEAGRWRDALSVLRRAVKGYEELMEHNPERYREPFATALQNLGSFTAISLKGKEQNAEAAGFLERARVLYERLVEDDASAHSRRLAACLNNLSLCLLRLDRRDEAMVHGERAAQLYAWLGASRHDEDADITAELAGSLISLSVLYGQRGLHATAAECCRRAVDLCEQQAEEDDAIALKLAVALTELGRQCADLGRPSDGIACSLRAVEITRRRAEQLPEQFHHQLVDALTILNRCYVNSGRPGEALKHILASMTIIEAMAETHPWRFLPALGDVYGLLAVVFDALGRDTTALHFAERAVEVSRQLSDQDPVVYLPVLSENLRRLADRYRSAGRLTEAFHHASRSVNIRRGLSDANPDRYLQELPDSLRSLAWVLNDTGMSQHAAACSEQAVGILRHLADRDPLRFRQLLAAQLSDHGVHCAHLGLREEAFDMAEEAVELYESLAEQDPHLHRKDLAVCLGNLGNRHRQLGQASSALPYCERAVEILEEFFAREPEQFRSELVGSLMNLSGCLAQVGRYEEGLRHSERALTLRQEVCEQEGRLGELALALPLNLHGRLLALVGRVEESLDAALRVAEIYQGEYRARTSLQSEYPAALAWVSERQALLGREREARATHRSEVTIWMDLTQRDAGFAEQLASAFRRYADTMEHFGHLGAARRLRDTAAHHDLIAPARAEQTVDLDDRFFIDSGWETVAVAIAAAQDGDTEAASWVDAFLVRRAQTSDWTPLAAALQRVRRGDGDTGSDDLFADLDPEDTLIVRRTLDLLRLPASERPVFTQGRADAAVVMAWRPNIEALLSAARRQPEEDSGLEEFLTELDEDPLWTQLATRVRRFLSGERGPQLRTDLDPFGRAVISTLLTRAEEWGSSD